MSVESLDRFQATLRSLVAEKAKTLPGLDHRNLRIEVREEKITVADFGLDEISEYMESA